MATRTTWPGSDLRTMPLRGGLPVRAIHGWCIRVCGLAALLLLCCDIIDTSTTRPANAQADMVAAQDAVPSVAPVPPTPTDRPADAYLARALDNYDQHDLNGAIADYTQALALQPNSADAYLGRGLAYYARGDMDGAIADFTQALALRPAAANIYNNRGLAYYDKGDREQAIADYTALPHLPCSGKERTNQLYYKDEYNCFFAGYHPTLCLARSRGHGH